MREKARRLVQIVAMVGLSILFGLRKDYPVAAILFIVAIVEAVGLFDRSTKKGIKYSFTAEGTSTVRDAFKSIGDEARNAQQTSPTTPREDETARNFRAQQAETRRKSFDDLFTTIPTTMITTEARMNSTSTTMRYSVVPKSSTESEAAINPPANPPAPGNPSE